MTFGTFYHIFTYMARKKALTHGPGKRPVNVIEISDEDRRNNCGQCVSIDIIMRVVDVKLRFPDATAREIAAMIGSSRAYVHRVLTTPAAKARLEAAYDLRPLVQTRMRNQTLNSLDYIGKLQVKGITDLDRERPDPALLGAATRASLETLKGVGLLKTEITETHRLDSQGLSDLVSKADQLRTQIQERIKARTKENFNQAEQVDAEIETVVREDLTEAE